MDNKLEEAIQYINNYFNGDIDVSHMQYLRWLVAKVGQSGSFEEAFFNSTKTIESLTKELAELKEEMAFINSEYLLVDDKNLTWDAQALKYKGLFKKLEAENAELKKHEEDMEEDFKFQMDKLTEELSTSEKALLDVEEKCKKLKSLHKMKSCNCSYPNWMNVGGTFKQCSHCGGWEQ